MKVLFFRLQAGPFDRLTFFSDIVSERRFRLPTWSGLAHHAFTRDLVLL